MNLLLRAQTCSRIRNFDAQCFCPIQRRQKKKSTKRAVTIPLQDRRTVAAADVVGDFGGKGFVVHEEKVNLSDVVDQELLETVGHNVLGLEKTQIRGKRDMTGSIHTFLLLP
jgi:hypothetical protein